MTYIVGIKEGNHTAIICDTKVTYDRPTDEIGFALKSGYLFEGCIYGAAADDARGIARFLEHWWDTVSRPLNRWESAKQFNDFVLNYDFDSFGHFQMILSCNAGDVPELYLFDTKDPQKTIAAGDFVSIGSGKAVLDDGLKLFRKTEAQEYLKDVRHPWDFPYIYTQWLMEQAQGFLALELEKHNVGGYFHFQSQSAETQMRQLPAVYVFSDMHVGNDEIFINGAPIGHFITRIAFLRDGRILAVEPVAPVNARKALYTSYIGTPREYKEFCKEDGGAAAHKKAIYDEYIADCSWHRYFGHSYSNPRLQHLRLFQFCQKTDPDHPLLGVKRDEKNHWILNDKIKMVTEAIFISANGYAVKDVQETICPTTGEKTRKFLLEDLLN